MKKIILSLLISLSIFAQAEDEYTNTTFKFLEVSGSNEAQRTMLKQLFTQLQQMQPDNPLLKDLADVMEKELKNLNLQLIPVYKKYISLEDMKALIKVYQNPVLKKLVTKQPLIIKESIQVGAVWGQQMAQKLLNK